MTGNKAYLITFIRGKRCVEEFTEFERVTPNPFTKEQIEVFGNKIIREKPMETTIKGISDLRMYFNLIGRNNKENKEDWNKFLDGLKLK